MKVLITGANGFIGSNLIRKLQNEPDMEIHTISRTPFGMDAAVVSHCCDILDRQGIFEIFEGQSFDVVVHLAALTAHEEIINNKNLSLGINLQGTENIVSAFNQFCTNAAFFYASSGKVYGRTNEMPITEEAIERPTTILGKGKYITERILDFHADAAGNKYVVMRIFNVYGGDQKENFIVPTLLKQLSKGNRLELGNIYDKRDYLYIDDLVTAIESLIYNRQKLSLFEIVNVGSGVPVSVEDMIEELKSILKLPELTVTVSQERMRHDETAVEYCSTKKIHELTGWERKFDLRAGLTETCRRWGMIGKYIAVIQAGGKGTRVRELTQDEIPKPLLEINGKTMLEWQIENLMQNGIREIIVITGYLGDRIEAYIGDGSKWGIRISYIRETAPLGSAGALYYLKGRCNGDILLIFGDVMFDIDWKRFINFHEKKGGLATLLVHPNSHPQDSDLVVLNDDGKVLSFDYKDHVRNYFYENCVNAGIYILSEAVLERFSKVQKTDLEKDILLPLVEEGRVYGYRTPEYVKDAGTPERFFKVSGEQKEGIWSRKNLQNRQACVFLDRDGTVNRYGGLLYAEEQFELEAGVAGAVRRLNEAGYLVILVTNQPVVARGLCRIEDVKRIHRKMQVLLGEEGAYLDDILFCPHHPDKGFAGENILYKVPCNCRKPATGMIAHAVEKYNIDLSQSFIIGDSTIDIQTGKNAGTQTILLLTGQAGKDEKYDAKPDFTARNLMEAVTIVLQNRSRGLEDTE